MPPSSSTCPRCPPEPASLILLTGHLRHRRGPRLQTGGAPRLQLQLIVGIEWAAVTRTPLQGARTSAGRHAGTGGGGSLLGGPSDIGQADDARAVDDRRS